MAQEQVQLEFPQEFAMLPQLQQAAVQNPAAKQQFQQVSQTIEARKAILIADMTEEFLKEEKTITSQFDHDPLLKLKQREVDLKAMESERKLKETDARINLDQAKMVQNREITDDKLEQNEELANLRANTSIEKTILSKSIPNVDKMIPSVEIEKYKGENR